MKLSPYILCFEDFDSINSVDINEASQDTLKRLQMQKQSAASRLAMIKKKQQESSENENRIKERESKSKDDSVKKIYAARVAEEKIRQQLYDIRMQAVQQAERLIDQKLMVANLRLQNRAQKKV
jgi:hypothetical protein